MDEIRTFAVEQAVRSSPPYENAEQLIDRAQAIYDFVVSAPAPAKARVKDAGRAKGGRARALSLTPERRVEIARLAAKRRWKK